MSCPFKKKRDTADEEEGEEEEDEEESMVDKIPRSHEIKLVHGSKPISALALDPSGARVISGSVDYDLKFWDFAGMDPSLRSFRKLRPCESHVINHLGEESLTCAFILVGWIRIWIRIGNKDPGPGGPNLPTKVKKI
jgi:hypothetical protein